MHLLDFIIDELIIVSVKFPSVYVLDLNLAVISILSRSTSHQKQELNRAKALRRKGTQLS